MRLSNSKSLLRIEALTRFGQFFQRKLLGVEQAYRVFVRVITGLRQLGNDLALLPPVYATTILPTLSF